MDQIEFFFRKGLGMTDFGLFDGALRRMVEQFVLETSPACAPDDAAKPPLVAEGWTCRSVVVTQDRPATVAVRLGAPGWWRARVRAPRVFGDVGVEVTASSGGASLDGAQVVASPDGATATFRTFGFGETVVVRLFLRDDTRAAADVWFERVGDAPEP